MTALWKLAWALPLVIFTGVVLVLLLKRVLVPSALGQRSSQRIQSRESLQVSEQTRLHLVEIDGRSYLLIESNQQAQLQTIADRPAPGARWLRQVTRGSQR